MKKLNQLFGKCFIVIIIFYFFELTKIIAQPRTGNWTVPTDFGQFVITVGCDGSCITDIIYTWSNFHCDGITLVSGSIHSMRTGGWAITDRNFSIQTSLGTSQTITINGTFGVSGNQVSGTYSVNIYGTVCAGVWGPIMSSIDNSGYNIPANYYLYQNYPNPFNPNTKIFFELPKSTFVTLKVYDLLGQEKTILMNKELLAGIHEINFDGTLFPSGIYFYKIQTRDFTQTMKMILLK